MEQITENPYLQYFIGLPGYQDTPPFDASTLVLLRKRITADMLSEAKLDFDACNESGRLIEAVERYRMRTGHCSGRVLADRIYRTRDNRAYCKKHGIRLSEPKLGRPSTDVKVERLDNTNRIEVEQFFSRSKRCYGLGCIVAKLFRIRKRILLRLFWQLFRYVAHIGRYSLKAA